MRKNKGKVYPSPSSSTTTSALQASPPAGDALSVLKLVPAAILALAAVLSPEDREVLAYLITRSIQSTCSPSPSTSSLRYKRNSSNTNTHKPPLFDCDCFDCYTSYWFRWDSSPNRELIHQAIEAFEDHLNNGEQSKKKGKKKDKMGHRRSVEKADSPPPKTQAIITQVPSPAKVEVQAKAEEEGLADIKQDQNATSDDAATVESPDAPPPEAVVAGVRAAATARPHKGLARKVLPDVLGLFNSRLWSLWSPNV